MLIIKISTLFIIFPFLNLGSANYINVKPKLEAEFVQAFGNVSPLHWNVAELMDISELKDICENAHIQAGKGSVDVVHAALEYGIIKLSDTIKYRNMYTLILKCVAEREYNLRGALRPRFLNFKREIILPEYDIFYLTQGTRPDNLHYLKRLENEKGIKGEKVFIIQQLVDGLLMSPENNFDEKLNCLHVKYNEKMRKKGVKTLTDISVDQTKRLDGDVKDYVDINKNTGTANPKNDLIYDRRTAQKTKNVENDVKNRDPNKSTKNSENDFVSKIFVDEIPLAIAYH